MGRPTLQGAEARAGDWAGALTGYEAMIARRYLSFRQQHHFIALISLIATAGIVVGVFALVVVLSAVNGFEDEVRAKIVGTNAHIVVLSGDPAGLTDPDQIAAQVSALPEVRASAPMVFTKAMLAHAAYSDGVVVKGIDLERERQVTRVPSFMTAIDPEVTVRLQHEAPTIDDVTLGTLPGIVLGSDVAWRLHAAAGDTVQMTSPLRTVKTPLGVVPLVQKFEVVGTFRSGMYEYDSSFCYVSLEAAQRFLQMDERVTGVQLKLADMYHAPEVDAAIEAMLGGLYWANNWITVNATLFDWMRYEKRLMWVILGLIVLVAAFNVTAMLFMIVMNKKRDVAVLRSMGASVASVFKIFVLEGLFVSLIGTAIGAVLGVLACWANERYKLVQIPSDVYFIDHLPTRVDAVDVAWVVALAIALALVATLYPAYVAAKRPPAESMRYE